MTDKELDKLFADQLQNLESPVNPEIWTRVSGSIAQAGSTAAVVGTAGISKLTLAIAAAVFAGTIAAVTFFYTNKDSDLKQSEQVVSSSTVASENKEVAKVEEPSSIGINPEIEKVKQAENAIIAATQSVANQENTLSANNSTSPDLDANATTNSAPPQANTPAAIPQINGVDGKQTQNDPQDSNPDKLEAEPDNLGQTKEDEKAIPSVPKDDVAQYLDLERISNVMTPNGDGLNDEFKVIVNNMKVVNMVIYERNGKTIKSVQNGTAELVWDGKDKNGNQVSTGTYFYFIFGETIHNSPLVHRGSIDIR
ncbi:MAG: gliding motility-associated C-terminal domain-containing protein [Bacteroidetes bacterium]|nr:gliding motility-associated C-terminal domain-containing protein [Bacteroidota bacterium]